MTPNQKLISKIFLELCSHCGKNCGNDDNFCSYCGVKNVNFDEAELIEEQGCDLAALLEQCWAGHEPTPQWPEIRYCCHCGSQIMFLIPVTNQHRQN